VYVWRGCIAQFRGRKKTRKNKKNTHIPPDTTKAFHGLTAGQN